MVLSSSTWSILHTHKHAHTLHTCQHTKNTWLTSLNWVQRWTCGEREEEEKWKREDVEVTGFLHAPLTGHTTESLQTSSYSSSSSFSSTASISSQQTHSLTTHTNGLSQRMGCLWNPGLPHRPLTHLFSTHPFTFITSPHVWHKTHSQTDVLLLNWLLHYHWSIGATIMLPPPCFTQFRFLFASVFLVWFSLSTLSSYLCRNVHSFSHHCTS